MNFEHNNYISQFGNIHVELEKIKSGANNYTQPKYSSETNSLFLYSQKEMILTKISNHLTHLKFNTHLAKQMCFETEDAILNI